MRKTKARPSFRVVLDTSVYISATLSAKGFSNRVWALARERRFNLVTSPFIVSEVAKVLRRFEQIDERMIIQRIKEIAHLAEIVQPQTKLNIARDVNDNPIIECAVEGKVDMIVSLDKDLLILKAYENIPIMHVTDLMRVLGEL